MKSANGYYVDGDLIVINRDLTKLDLFVKDFISILKEHSDYLVVSGYVSISTGRTRATEDVDILIPIMEKERFKQLFNDLTKNNFWCYQSDNYEEAYTYLEDFSNIRFAKKNEIFPNIEFVPIDKKRKSKSFEFNHPQKIKIKDFEFNIPPLEFEIIYKEIILAGDKDILDAKHLRSFFEKILKEEKFKEYKLIIEGDENVRNNN
ncbi:MAG: hypothetical protein AABW83_01275 [Nanoarchaeota archaeon]